MSCRSDHTCELGSFACAGCGGPPHGRCPRPPHETTCLLMEAVGGWSWRESELDGDQESGWVGVSKPLITSNTMPASVVDLSELWRSGEDCGGSLIGGVTLPTV